jgi:ABC-2 type transport system ATP-binding protein
MTPVPIIETTGLSKRYGNVSAVDDLSLTVPASRITGFLGRNGAGKSTTIKMLLGMIRPTSGTGSVMGHPIDDPAESCTMRRSVAYVAEDKPVYSFMTVGQTIAFTRAFYADWRMDVERMLLARYELPKDRLVKALSKGMRTKLALLLALARQPALLILDEPSDGLDPVSIEELLQSLTSAAADGTSVFFSSHRIDEVERISDAVCILDRGKLRLHVEMDVLREQFRAITASFPGAAPQFSSKPSGVEHVAIAGRQCTLLVSQDLDAVVAHAYAMGATTVDIRPVSLREVFLAVHVEAADERGTNHV